MDAVTPNQRKFRRITLKTVMTAVGFTTPQAFI